MYEDNASDTVIGVLREIRTLARDGAPGDRLPSVRTLVARHHVSPLTVQAAIRTASAEGLVDVQPGKGSYIAAPRAETPTADLSWQSVALGPGRQGEEVLSSLLAVPSEHAITLSSGYIDSTLQPVTALGAALARAARQPTSWERGPIEGRHDLRGWFAREAGGRLRAADMTICSGGQPALATAFRGLAAPGDVLLVESPTYLGAIAAGRDAGLRVVPVPADADGVRPDLLADAFRRTGARLFYCQPLHANPHGGVLATSRRADVLAAAADAGAFIMEDDWARGLTIDGTPPPPLAADDVNGHVVYLRSLTKVVAPGLRVAAIGARGVAGTRLRTARVLDDFFVAGPLQAATIDFVTSPAWRRHFTALRSGLHTRRDALLAALRTHLPHLAPSTPPSGGLHVWLRLPEDVDESALVTAAAAQNVVVFGGRPWFAAEAPAPHLRLSIGGAPADSYDDGVRRLSRAFTTV
ncbi:MAG: aminotransferase class I/II-fold pyridoxal phosphate-dependent enzyme [Actinophytocola sp.]|nr:aminotransferase class I/II-fold pyridoxal phosphate-dependent enzyme [Actinophytocola sp.]